MLAGRETTGWSNALFVGLLLAAALPGVVAEDGKDCTPRLEGRLEEQNHDAGRNLTTLLFAIDVSVVEPACMAVHFDLVIREGLADGGEKIVVLGQRVKVDDEAVIHNVRHEMPAEHDLVDWEVKFTECRRCGPED